jgi:hypothetical protein
MKKIFILPAILFLAGTELHSSSITWSNGLTYVNTNGVAADTYAQLIKGPAVAAKYFSYLDAIQNGGSAETYQVWDSANLRFINFAHEWPEQLGGDFGSAPIDTGVPILDRVLATGYQGGGGQGSLLITLQGLTAGNKYSVQLFSSSSYGFWVNNKTPAPEYQNFNVYHLEDSNDPNFEFHGPNTEPPLGHPYGSYPWYITGDFVADSETQIIVMYSALRDSLSPPPWGNPSINAYILTDQSTPIDSDGDGVNDYREDKDGTDPNDPNSFNPLSKGLVAHYPFEHTFEDQAQSNPPATPYNSDKVAFTQDLNLKRSVLSVTGEGFLGTNGGYVQIPRPNGLGTTATFSMNFLEIGYSHHHGQDFIHFADTSFGLVGHRHFRDEGIPGFFAMGTQINNELPSFTYNPSDDSVAINNPQWISYQVVISNGVSSIYRNGLLIAQVPGVVPTSGDIYLNYANWGDVSTRITASYSDVRIYNRSLSNVELAQLYIDSLGCLDSDNDGVTDAAEFLPDFAAVQLVSGREYVTSNPSEFNLFTQSEYNANFTKGITQGRADVISNPGDFGLFNDSSLADVNLGGVVMRKLGNAVNLEVQVQTTPDIKSQSFTNLPYKHLLYIDGLPTDKSFLRVRALGPQ